MVRTYIENVLVITRYNPVDHMNDLDFLLKRAEAGLKVNM